MKKLVLALAAVALIATPAMADYSFYGSARVATVYASQDDGTNSTDKFDVVLQGNSRFGLKASTGDVSGRIEFGTGVNLRLLYGEVKMGGGTLLVGQSYTPQTKFSNQALNQDLGFIGFGALYDGRQPQIKYTMDSGLYFAAIKNGKLDSDADYIPKLSVGFKGAAGSINYNAGFGFQQYNIAGAVDENITSYIAFLCGDAKFGEVGFIYGIHYGQNMGDYGISGRSASANYTGGNDSTGLGAMIEADIAGFAMGVGYISDEIDNAANADAQMALFVNYTAQMAKGFKIVPEVTYLDYIENAAGNDEGTDILVGAKFQMDF